MPICWHVDRVYARFSRNPSGARRRVGLSKGFPLTTARNIRVARPFTVCINRRYTLPRAPTRTRAHNTCGYKTARESAKVWLYECVYTATLLRGRKNTKRKKDRRSCLGRFDDGDMRARYACIITMHGFTPSSVVARVDVKRQFA